MNRKDEQAQGSELSGGLGAWTKCKDLMPPRDVDVLVVCSDGLFWVGSRCNWSNCDHIHYQSDSHEANYIPDPEYWMHLPAKPRA